VRRSLPGFSIDLPAGDETVAQLDYRAGKLRREKLGGGEGMLAIYWMFGKVVDGPAALDIARMAARSDGFDPERAQLLEHKANGMSLVSIDPERTKLQSYTQCGARTISLATAHVSEPVHRQIIDSLHCEPDPSQEAAATSIPIAIDLPEFVAFQRTPGTVALTSETSTVMLRLQSSTSLTIADLERDSATLFKVMKLDAQAQPRRGGLIPFIANVEGNREWGVLRPIDCATSKVLVIAFSGDPKSARDLEQRVEAAHCLGPGESPPAWPDAPPDPAAATGTSP
jgi:hypothetical protein